MWADFYKRWCDLWCSWLPKTSPEQGGSEETSHPETTNDQVPGKTETAEEGSGTTPGAVGDDDVTVIKGIGPTMKEKLAGLGIASLADLAAADPDDLATKLSSSSSARLKGWIAAAQERTAGS